MNIKQEVRTKIHQMNIDAFFKTNFVGFNSCFVLIYSNQGENAKRFKFQRYDLPKDIIKNYNVITNGKSF